MKIKILVAFIATIIIVVLSCTWFRSGKNQNSNPLPGQWKLDSIRFSPKDTGFFITDAIIHDSSLTGLSFTKDTIFARSKDHVDMLAYSFDEKTNQLTARDSPAQTMTFKPLNGSSASLTTKNGMILFLQKK